MAVVIFENPSAPKGETGKPLKRIRASIRFRGSIENVSVNAAYWLDSDHSLMDIPPGQERTVVLGHFEGPSRETFVSYDNRYSMPNQSRRPAHQLSDPTLIAASHNIKADITLIDSDHVTVEKATIEIDIMTLDIKGIVNS